MPLTTCLSQEIPTYRRFCDAVNKTLNKCSSVQY